MTLRSVGFDWVKSPLPPTPTTARVPAAPVHGRLLYTDGEERCRGVMKVVSDTAGRARFNTVLEAPGTKPSDSMTAEGTDFPSVRKVAEVQARGY